MPSCVKESFSVFLGFTTIIPISFYRYCFIYFIALCCFVFSYFKVFITIHKWLIVPVLHCGLGEFAGNRLEWLHSEALGVPCQYSRHLSQGFTSCKLIIKCLSNFPRLSLPSFPVFFFFYLTSALLLMCNKPGFGTPWTASRLDVLSIQRFWWHGCSQGSFHLLFPSGHFDPWHQHDISLCTAFGTILHEPDW